MLDSSVKDRHSPIEESYVVGDMDMSGVELDADQMEAALNELNAEPDHVPTGSQNRYNPLRARRWFFSFKFNITQTYAEKQYIVSPNRLEAPLFGGEFIFFPLLIAFAI